MRKRVKKIALVLLGASLGAQLTVLPPVSNAAPSPLEEPAPIAELEEAYQTGQGVVVDELTTETEQVEANPDGTFTLVANAIPVRVNEDGEWKPIDTNLSESPDGRFEPARTAVEMSFSAGGDDLLATSRTDDGEVTLHTPFVLPAPAVHGDTLTYAEVLPGVDLVVHVGAESYSEVLVVKDAEAAANPTLQSLDFALSSPALMFETDDNGQTEAVNASGDAVFTAPTPLMWDAEKAPSASEAPDSRTSADTISEVAVDAEPSDNPYKATITLTPPAELLTGPDVTYPVHIDPTIGPSRNYFVVARSNGASTIYNDSAQDFRVGYCGWSGCSPYYKARTYFNFKVTTLNAYEGKKPVIEAASVTVEQTHNGSSASTPVQLHRSGSINGDTEWAGPIGSLLETKSKSGTGAIQFSGSAIKAYVQEQTHSSNLTFAMRAPNESDPYQWKRFDNKPVLTVKYAFPVGVPSGLAVTNALTCSTRLYARTTTPMFTATGHEYNSNGPVPIEVEFEILDSSGASEYKGIKSTTRGTKVSWTTPSSLTNGDYRVRARTKANANDGTDTTSSWTSAVAFTVDTTVPGTPSTKSFTHPLGYNETSGALTTVPGDKSSGTFLLTSSDPRVTGFAYAFNSSSVPAPTGTNCLTATGSSNPDGSQGFIKAIGGNATLSLPATVTGSSYLRIKAIDEAGNASPTTASYNFIRPSTATSYKNFTLADAVTGSGAGTWTTNSQTYLPDGSQLYVSSPTVGSKYSVSFTVTSGGTWQLEPLMVRAASHGKVQFAVDDVPVGITDLDPITGEEFIVPVEKNMSLTPEGSFYGAELIPIGLSLSEGTHKLTVISSGAGISGGTSFALDALRLVNLG